MKKRDALCHKKVRKIIRKKQSILRTVALLISNFLYWGVLFVLTGVTISVVFQQIANPEKIPHVFGYKIFIILDDYMTDELQKGDLIASAAGRRRSACRRPAGRRGGPDSPAGGRCVPW